MRATVLVVTIAAMLSACATDAPRTDFGTSNRLSSMEASIETLKRQQERTDCLVRLTLVQSTCSSLLAGETNSASLQVKLATCVREKGFPRGDRSCPAAAATTP